MGAQRYTIVPRAALRPPPRIAGPRCAAHSPPTKPTPQASLSFSGLNRPCGHRGVGEGATIVSCCCCPLPRHCARNRPAAHPPLPRAPRCAQRCAGRGAGPGPPRSAEGPPSAVEQQPAGASAAPAAAAPSCAGRQCRSLHGAAAAGAAAAGGLQAHQAQARLPSALRAGGCWCCCCF